MKKLLTLCIIFQHPKILLGMKKRGFGAGRWNGFGGKVENGESVENAAAREVREEAGVEAENLSKVGIIDFEFSHNDEIHEVHVFMTDQFLGEPQETEEMKPQWFEFHEIPYDQMWQDDKYWLPLVLAGKKIKARFLFDEHDKMLESRIDEVKAL